MAARYLIIAFVAVSTSAKTIRTGHAIFSDSLQAQQHTSQPTSVAPLVVANDPLVKPSIERTMEDLYGADGAKTVEALLERLKQIPPATSGGVWPECPACAVQHAATYGELLKLMINQRGETASDDFEKNREMQTAYVQKLYTDLIQPVHPSHIDQSSMKQSIPTATFLFGGTAVGKSTFAKTLDIEPNTVHVNADDIRSLLVGNYKVYTQIINAAQFPGCNKNKETKEVINGHAACDANKIRTSVQAKCLESKANFFTDSYSAPVSAIHGFATKQYQVNAYFLELGFKGVPGYDGKPETDLTYAAKTKISIERIQKRIDAGNHGSGDKSQGSTELMAPDLLQKTRTAMTTVAIALKAMKPPVLIHLVISQNNEFIKVEDLSLVDPTNANPLPTTTSFVAVVTPIASPVALPGQIINPDVSQQTGVAKGVAQDV